MRDGLLFLSRYIYCMFDSFPSNQLAAHQRFLEKVTSPAYCIKMRLLTLLTLVCCLALSSTMIPSKCDQCRNCVKYAYRQISRQVCTRYGVEYYKTKCGFWGWRSCTKTRTKCIQYGTRYFTQRYCVGYEIIPNCVCPMQ